MTLHISRLKYEMDATQAKIAVLVKDAQSSKTVRRVIQGEINRLYSELKTSSSKEVGPHRRLAGLIVQKGRIEKQQKSSAQLLSLYNARCSALERLISALLSGAPEDTDTRATPSSEAVCDRPATRISSIKSLESVH